MEIIKLKSDDELITYRMRTYNESFAQAEEYILKMRSKMFFYLLTMLVKRVYKNIKNFLKCSV